MANQVISIQLTGKQIEKLKRTWPEAITEKTPDYARFQMRLSDCVVTCYQSGKTVFQGKDADIYASAFQPRKEIILPQAGSDEVGTGDYFGPVCVCAVILDKENQKMIDTYSIQDSKQLTDEQIRKIAPKLKKKLKHSLLIVSPEKYNQVHQNHNMNQIKALLHNQAYLNLQKKYQLPSFCVVDQFTPEARYYQYLKNEKKIVTNLTFETKAENKYPAVGTASILARNAFLETMDQLNQTYEMEFQKGAGPKVDQCALEFIEKYGWPALSKVAKLHFKNTDKVKEMLSL